MTKPLDKILCERKFYRYVVACMHNCHNPHHCREFWKFFRAIGKTPAEYYNEGGIGDSVMRRVVFDCDRCGKRDIGEVFGPYTTSGEGEEYRLSDTEKSEALLRTGYANADVLRLSYLMLDELEGTRSWQHYCRKCFQVITDGVARMLNEKVTPPTRKKKPVKKPEPEPTPMPEKSPEPPVTKAKAAPKKKKKPKKAAQGAGLRL